MYPKSDTRNGAFKGVVNSFVGKLGSERECMAQFRNPYLHADIMEASRQSILRLAKACQGQSLAIYTDACFTIGL